MVDLTALFFKWKSRMLSLVWLSSLFCCCSKPKGITNALIYIGCCPNKRLCLLSHYKTKVISFSFSLFFKKPKQCLFPFFLFFAPKEKQWPNKLIGVNESHCTHLASASGLRACDTFTPLITVEDGSWNQSSWYGWIFSRFYIKSWRHVMFWGKLLSLHEIHESLANRKANRLFCLQRCH